MIRIITDTASDITRAQAQALDITLLSLPVTFGKSPYIQLDDADFTHFYNLLEQSKELPVTSLTPPGDYLEQFEQAKEQGDSVIAIPLSAKLSGSFGSACLAKEMVGYDDIHIVDSNQALIGQRLLVEHAVHLRQQGVSAADIAARVTELSGRIRLFGVLDTLKYLIKGGRLSKTAGMVGSALGIKPLVCLRDGAVSVAGKARGRDGAAAVLLDAIAQDAAFDPAFPFCFGYTKTPEQLDGFAALATEKFGPEHVKTYPVGGVIGTHIGPNAMVTVWVVKE